MREDIAARITLGVGNVVRTPADAVVNPTDSSLGNRSGVSGAIHRAAGPELRKACVAKAPCQEGQARVTGGYRLPMPYVIHMVVPGNSRSLDATRKVREAYLSMLEICERLEVKVVNVPPAPMGPKGLLPAAAARLALEAMAAWLSESPVPERIHICCFTATECSAYEVAFEALLSEERPRPTPVE